MPYKKTAYKKSLLDGSARLKIAFNFNYISYTAFAVAGLFYIYTGKPINYSHFSMAIRGRRVVTFANRSSHACAGNGSLCTIAIPRLTAKQHKK